MSNNQTDWLYLEKLPEVRQRVVDEFLGGHHARQPWRVFPAGRLERIWSEAAEGFVRDTKGLDSLADLVIENVLRLQFNTEIAGHTALSTEDALEDWPEISDRQDAFVDWAIDDGKGGWRISDYGLDKLFGLVDRILEAEEPLARVTLLDQALNIMHQRSDLSSWFIEGGTQTLNGLSASPERQPETRLARRKP